MASLRSQQDLHHASLNGPDHPKSSSASAGYMRYSNLRAKKQIRAGARVSPCSCGYGVFIVTALCLVSFTIVGGNYLFSLLRSHKGRPAWLQAQDFFERQDELQRNDSDPFKLTTNWRHQIDDKNDHEKKRDLQFEKTFGVEDDSVNRDSRYWDKDDRKRKKYSEYDDDKVNERQESSLHHKQEPSLKLSNTGDGGLYNEKGRKELRDHEQKLEDAFEREHYASKGHHTLGLNGREKPLNDDHNGVGKSVGHLNSTKGVRKDNEGFLSNLYEEEDSQAYLKQSHKFQPDRELENENVESSKTFNEILKENTRGKRSETEIEERTVQRSRHRQRYPCHIDFLNSTNGFPEPNRRFLNFSLSYVQYEDSQITGREARFAGHQTLLQRNQSFQAMDQTVHCGFVRESGSSRTSGFDLSEEDTQYMSTCKVAVTSCIFGSSDNIRSPRNRVTGMLKKNVCFVMFVDQQTLDVLKEEGQELDERGYLGLWKVVLVRNLPYTDARRVGKIPKFLAHRLFPTARFSIWLDSKLRLQIDPTLLLEYFLWRRGYEYAISNHYDRHCVWEEVQQNKKLNKYNHTVIDEQFAFYQRDGLTRFNASDPKKLLPSYVPEGSFIIREHSPMSNLFSCLWFNEVDRFTSRDQLSFAYTYLKLVRTNPGKRFYLNMFKDCERKNIAKLFRHRKASPDSTLSGAIM